MAGEKVPWLRAPAALADDHIGSSAPPSQSSQTLITPVLRGSDTQFWLLRAPAYMHKNKCIILKRILRIDSFKAVMISHLIKTMLFGG